MTFCHDILEYTEMMQKGWFCMKHKKMKSELRILFDNIADT